MWSGHTSKNSKIEATADSLLQPAESFSLAIRETRPCRLGLIVPN